MTTKSTWLQLRLTPAEKDALRERAAQAGVDLSTYVLSRALGKQRRLFDEHIAWMLAKPDSHVPYAEFEDYLLTLPASRGLELAELPARFDELTPFQQNLVAAKVEMRAALWGVHPPTWTLDVPGLERPHYSGGLINMRPYLLLRSPVVFRRRNLFVEYGLGGRLAPLSPPATPEEAALLQDAFQRAERRTRRRRVAEESPRWGADDELSTAQIRQLLAALNDELGQGGVRAEFHIVGGAVMCLVFNARETTKDVDGLFFPASEVRAAVERIAEREGIAPDWLNDAVKGFLAPRGAFDPYLELEHLRIFVARPDYLFAMKCLAMRLDSEYHDRDDILFLARILDVRRADAAMDVIERFYPLSRISPRIRFALEELLA